MTAATMPCRLGQLLCSCPEIDNLVCAGFNCTFPRNVEQRVLGLTCLLVQANALLGMASAMAAVAIRQYMRVRFILRPCQWVSKLASRRSASRGPCPLAPYSHSAVRDGLA